jgi:hypothetical protein
MFSRSTDNGNNFNTSYVLANGINELIPVDLAAAGNNVYILWIDQQNGDIVFKRSTDNGNNFNTSYVLANREDWDREINLAASESYVYVTFMTDIDSVERNSIIMKFSYDNGTEFQEFPVELNVDRFINSMQIAPSSVINSPYMVIGVNSEILFRSVYPVFEPINLSTNGANSESPAIATSNGFVYVIWNDDISGKDEIVLTVDGSHGSGGFGVFNRWVPYYVGTGLLFLAVFVIIFLWARRRRRVSGYRSQIKQIRENSDLTREKRLEQLNELEGRIDETVKKGKIGTHACDMLKEEITESRTRLFVIQQVPRIHQIIELHDILMLEYRKLIFSITKGSIPNKFVYELNSQDKQGICNELGVIARSQLRLNLIFTHYLTRSFIANLISAVRKKDRPKLSSFCFSRRISTRILGFFIKSHIRRRLSRLNSLYLQEIATQSNSVSDQKEIEAIRRISSDIKEYHNTLPSSRQLAGLLSFIALVIGLVQAFGMGNLLSDYMYSVNCQLLGQTFNAAANECQPQTNSSPYGYHYLFDLLLFVVTPVVIIAVACTVKLTNNSFRAKRSLLVGSNSILPYWDIYPKSSRKLFANSIYLLEDRLFETLYAGRDQPTEIPNDKIISLIAGGAFYVVIFNILIPLYFGPIIESLNFFDLLLFSPTPEQSLYIAVVGIILVISGLWIFIPPFVEYRRRRISRLI